MRLDKFLSNMGMGSRTDVKKLLARGMVQVNGQVVTSAKQHIHEQKDTVTCGGNLVAYKPLVYLMLNKPQGVVSATEDKRDATVLDLVPPAYQHYDLFPAGRLDKDTVGLLLLTNDGLLAHQLLSPKYHVGKTYFVEAKTPLCRDDVKRLEEGVEITGGYLTKPAKAKWQADQAHHLLLTITEGKYHQVKEMLKAVNNEVVFLERQVFGPLSLDPALERGQMRELTDQEIKSLIASAEGIHA